LPADALGRRQVYIFLIETKKKTNLETKTAVSENVKTLVNLELIRRGYAKTVKSYHGQYQEPFQLAEAEAKKAKVGLWRG
jgi:endonuclease YncB( thermonuclease family)